MNIVVLFWLLCISSIIGYLTTNKPVLKNKKITSRAFNKNNQNQNF